MVFDLMGNPQGKMILSGASGLHKSEAGSFVSDALALTDQHLVHW